MPKTNEANDASTITRSLTPFEQFEARRVQSKRQMQIAHECLNIVQHEELIETLASRGVDVTPLRELLDARVVQMAAEMQSLTGAQA